MRFFGVFVLSLLSGAAMASDTFNCVYSKANVKNGVMGPAIGRDKVVVEVIGGSMKSYRPNGTFIYSPPMTEDKKTVWMASDSSKVYAMSQDFTSFAVTDKIAKVTEQWSECILDKAKPADVHNKNVNWQKRALTSSEKSAIENAVRDRLKDPESARFKHGEYVSNGGGAYCGLVNSKNSYGGYVGDEPFMVMITHNKGKTTGAGAISVGGDADELQATIQVCRDNGYF